MIKIPESAVKYIKLQCNNKIGSYIDCKELALSQDFLSKLNPKNVLELGAGLGRVSVFLKNRFNWNDTNFFLLDGNSGNKQLSGLRKMGKDFYNSLGSTRDFCLANGIKEKNLFLINAEEDIKLPENKFDLCYSYKAIGFHWPINPYLDMIQHSMLKGSYLLFELRTTNKKRNRTPMQQKRVENFDNYQIEHINQKIYEIISLDLNAIYPMLLLKKIKEVE